MYSKSACISGTEITSLKYHYGMREPVELCVYCKPCTWLDFYSNFEFSL